VYKKGQRLVFSSHKDKRGKPSSSTKQALTTKGKKTLEHELGIIDLEKENEISIMKQTIRDKKYQIKELEINMERAKFIISFLEQENSQLKAKELIKEKEKAKLLQQVGKAKEII